MLEKFLTAPPEEFKSYLREAPPLTEDEVDDRREAYRYSKVCLAPNSQSPSTDLCFLSAVEEIHHAIPIGLY